MNLSKPQRMNVSMRIATAVATVGSSLTPLGIHGQEGRAAPGPRPLAQALADVQALAERSAAELAEVREAITAEQLPLLKTLDQLEEELAEVNNAYEETLKIREARTLDVSTTKSRIDAREKTNEYLANQLDQYIREFESLLHVAEVQRYGEELTAARRRARADASLEEALEGRLATVELSIGRLEEVAGGSLFGGRATDPDGIVAPGMFALVGPVAFFAGDGPGHVGLADDKTGSSEPTVLPLPEEHLAAVRDFIANRSGSLPIDITEGNAFKLEETKETLGEEFAKGGFVMYPLLGLGAMSVLITVIKWVQLMLVNGIGRKRFNRLLEDLDRGDKAAATEKLKGVHGPVGKMLRSGIEHHADPTELLEEVLFEDMLKARQRLTSLIPFIKITAAAAPLLGLLGTVSGMINTFKLITVFGTGDASTFSAGISEALITTKWGLIVAIPCLLIAASLNRKAKGIIDDMESLALAFVNHFRGDEHDDHDHEEPEEQSARGAGERQPPLATGSDGSPEPARA
jgi:biopolymer transport protein ExbB